MKQKTELYRAVAELSLLQKITNKIKQNYKDGWVVHAMTKGDVMVEHVHQEMLVVYRKME